jgi:hypothetical protein
LCPALWVRSRYDYERYKEKKQVKKSKQWEGDEENPPPLPGKPS